MLRYSGIDTSGCTGKVRRAFLLLWLVVASCLGPSALAAPSELHKIQQATLLPQASRLLSIAEKNTEQSLIARQIMSRSLLSAPADDASGYPCAHVATHERRLACQLLLIGQAFNRKDYPALVRLYSLLDPARKASWARDVPALNDESLVAIKRFVPFEHRIIEPRTRLEWQTVDNGFLAIRAKPNLTLKINGTPVRAKLDTAASVSLLSAVDAQRLNLSGSPWGFQLASAYQAGTSQVKMALVQELQFAGHEFKNVAIAVGGQDSVVGLDLITLLGRVSIDASGITLGDRTPVSSCDSQVLLGGNFSRTRQYLFTDILVGGQQAKVVLDTGNIEFLSGGEPPAAGVASPVSNRFSDVTGQYHEVNYQVSETIVLAGRQRSINRVYSPTRHYPLPYFLGWNAFDDYRLVIDFDQGWGCLNNVR